MISKIIKSIKIYGCIVIIFFALLFSMYNVNAQNYTVGVPVRDTVCTNIMLDTGTFNEDYMLIQIDSTLSSYVTGLNFNVEIKEIHGFATSNMLDTLQVGDILTIPAASDSEVLKITILGKGNFTKFNIIIIGMPIVEGEVYFCNINCAITLAVLFNSATVYAEDEETCTVQPNTSIDREQDKYVPGEFKLNQNYPNPFNLSTIIKYNLLKSNFVTLKLYNLAGQEIITLVDGFQSKSKHEIKWTAERLSSGIYFYRMQVGEYWETKKLIIQK